MQGGCLHRGARVPVGLRAHVQGEELGHVCSLVPVCAQALGVDVRWYACAAGAPVPAAVLCAPWVLPCPGVTARTTQHWRGLPGEAVLSLSLEGFQTWWDPAVSKLV